MKRQHNQKDNHLNNNGKKRRINNTMTSKLFVFTTDQERFQLLYNTIRGTELIQSCNVDDNVIQLLSEFANGQFISCLHCKILNSFLHSDICGLRQVECINCGTALWAYQCSFHQKQTTIRKNDIGPKCCQCQRSMCYDLTLECIRCKKWICPYCIGDDLRCVECQLPKTSQGKININ